MSDFPCALINDGYSRRGFVKERKHCYPAVRFRYRPVPIEDHTTIARALQDAPTGQAEAHLFVKTVGKYVETWNVVDRDGKPVELRSEKGAPNVAVLTKVDTLLLMKIYNIVMMNTETDEDPEWEPGESPIKHEADKLFGEQEQDDVGNSPEG